MMLSPAVRMARDYNRALHAPVRIAHLAAATLRPAASLAAGRIPGAWSLAGPLLVGLIAALLLHPLDLPIAHALRRFHLSGDLYRELHAWQQYGAFGSLLFTALLIYLLDRPRARRALDLLAAAAVVGLSVTLLKGLVGRPRPPFDDPHTLLSPWGVYPLDVRLPTGGVELRLVHAWEHAARTSELWSTPSSHTAYAAALSIFLATLYPRLRALTLVMTILVASCRLAFNAHWLTDVVIGAAIGHAGARAAVSGFWGVRAVDWLWRRLIDPTATPAYPRMSLHP